MLTLKKYVVNLENVKPRVLRIPNTEPGVSCVEAAVDNSNIITTPSTQG